MLRVLGSAFQNCDGIPRRDVLRVGGLALGGLTLPGFLRLQALARERGEELKDTAVIQIFLGGGPSHIDMYDPKPEAPAEIRGEFRPIPTSVPGIRISEHLPFVAAVMDRIAVVRSVTHGNSSHLPSSHLILTGHEATDSPTDNLNPSTGSIVAKFRGPNARGMPAYAAVPRRTSFGGSAYLGGAYSPFLTEKEPNADDFAVPDLSLLPGISRGRLASRRDLLEDLDRMRRNMDLRGEAQGMDAFSRQALGMITSERAFKAFEIRREDPRTRDRYGRTSIGQNCLLARRLVEAGVTYVTCLSGGGWDTHKDNFSELRDVTLPRYDRAVSALVTDIHERGLAQRVLVMAMGEFGRSPRINRDAGRDHWPGAMSVLFSGGGLKTGQVVGATDAHGAYPTNAPYSPASVLATMYHVMGIDPHHVLHDRNNRPVPILGEGSPILELL